MRAGCLRQLQHTFSFLLRVVPVLHRDVILQCHFRSARQPQGLHSGAWQSYTCICIK